MKLVMQDTFYIVLMGSVSVALLLAFLHSRFQHLGHRSSLEKILAGMLFIAMIVVLSYLPALFCPHERISSPFYSIYFMANTWLSLSMAVFGWVYTGRHHLPHAARVLIVLCMAADNLLLVSNIWTKKEVTYAFAIKGATRCWVFHQEPLFALHLGLCYLFLLAFFITLIDQLVRSPWLYKFQYIMMLLGISVCVIGNAVFLMHSDIIDMSVVLYGLCGVELCYATFVYVPGRLIRDMGRLVLNRMNAALFFYNDKGECIYTNGLARLWLAEAGNADKAIVEKNTAENLKVFAERIGFDLKQQTDKQVIHRKRGAKDVYYHVSCQRFQDNRKRLIGSFLQMEDITAEVISQQERLYQATHDSLTGLYNQNSFYAQTRDILRYRKGVPYSIITTDIYMFKLFNELLGRDRADELLRLMAGVLRENAGEEEVYGRLEGDCFAICAPTQAALEITLSDALGKAVDQFIRQAGLTLATANYCGVYHIEEPDIQISAMCDRANIALTSIKGSIHSRIAYYDTRMRDDVLEKNAMIATFPRALQEHQFVIYLQPQINSENDSLIGAEALVRWNHPDHGLISPGRFVPLLEKHDLIYQLDQYVWEAACVCQKELRANGYHLPISVNISPSDIYRCDVVETLVGLVQKYDLSPDCLNLEITESSLVQDVNHMSGIIEALHGAGFRVEMDDFGSGYSSLNTLKDITVDVLKLDMKFMENVKTTQRGETILRAIMGMAQALHLPVIAEGVEHREQVDLLSAIGCHNIQGYYYAKPMPYEELCKLLLHREIGILK